MNKQIKNIAVITGDVVSSSKLNKEERKKLPALLKGSFGNLEKYFKKSIEGKLDIFGGDSFQFAVGNIPNSLRVALAYRLILKSGIFGFILDAKVSIGIGEIDFINKSKISESDGRAFRVSGRALTGLDKNQRLSFIYPDFNSQEEFSLFFVFLDSLISRYTPKQSLAVFGALADLNQDEISRLWNPPIKQQSVSNHINNAGYQAVEKFIIYYENRLKNL